MTAESRQRLQEEYQRLLSVSFTRRSDSSFTQATVLCFQGLRADAEPSSASGGDGAGGGGGAEPQRRLHALADEAFAAPLPELPAEVGSSALRHPLHPFTFMLHSCLALRVWFSWQSKRFPVISGMRGFSLDSFAM